MRSAYDTYYQTENLFGEPYPELLDFFAQNPKKEKVLDVGCGQGRNATALARMGYPVTGIDASHLGIEQMNRIAKAEKLDIVGELGDIYDFDRFGSFGIILLDSMLHFQKKEREKETGLLKKILADMGIGSLLVVCIQDTPQRIRVLNEAMDSENPPERVLEKKFTYAFEDRESGQAFDTKYRMFVVRK